LFTINAWMTPGNQASKVKRTLTRKVVPNPCFKKTAKGGSIIFKIIVTSDILFVFRFLTKVADLQGTG